jgi:hypothetical protein
MTLMLHKMPFRQQTFVRIQNPKGYLKTLCHQVLGQVTRYLRLYHMLSDFAVQIGSRPFDFDIDNTIQYLIDALHNNR